jgi:hypothetical protein
MASIDPGQLLGRGSPLLPYIASTAGPKEANITELQLLYSASKVESRKLAALCLVKLKSSCNTNHLPTRPALGGLLDFRAHVKRESGDQ